MITCRKDLNHHIVPHLDQGRILRPYPKQPHGRVPQTLRQTHHSSQAVLLGRILHPCRDEDLPKRHPGNHLPPSHRHPLPGPEPDKGSILPARSPYRSPGHDQVRRPPDRPALTVNSTVAAVSIPRVANRYGTPYGSVAPVRCGPVDLYFRKEPLAGRL
ncbi:hypothetical protein CONLIGDRAFT_324730 [Coniochaeta ligniaria NRRL 30616]|uniref:Uncharacterized protein n=1 Tax=Coniochaeta ligniaria NRRL 30616 TaxID=1408157 RepID=A0A1J7JNU5_9PEZI|nr:hypothetical protein CONLIGDRAFT_324730 [Coniochaeta ligniaria NRRL 30616]